MPSKKPWITASNLQMTIERLKEEIFDLNLQADFCNLLGQLDILHNCVSKQLVPEEESPSPRKPLWLERSCEPSVKQRKVPKPPLEPAVWKTGAKRAAALWLKAKESSTVNQMHALDERVQTVEEHKAARLTELVAVPEPVVKRRSRGPLSEEHKEKMRQGMARAKALKNKQ